MLIYLISEDRYLQDSCREVLTDLLGVGYVLRCICPHETTVDADLVLWDVMPQCGSLPVITEENNWRYCFFVDRSEREHLCNMVPVMHGNLLLKPVARTALMAFLETACEQARALRSHSTGSWQTTRDMLQCLMQTNLKLQEYDQDRTNFLARAIHDFRAPLTAISGYCELMLGQDVGNLTCEQRDVLERMQRSAKKLSRMANAMFQLSISPRAEASFNLERGEIRECIDQAVHEVLPAVQEKRLSVTCSVLAAPDPLQFDRTRIEQVVVNLLENACKFTPRGGHIEIRGYPCFWEDRFGTASMPGGLWSQTSPSPNAYRVDIRDSGPGIPAAHMTRIFEEYTRYAGGSDRSGGGLGLAICRMILTRHKGRIWAESTATGAMFSFVLPLQQPAVSHSYMFQATNSRSL